MGEEEEEEDELAEVSSEFQLYRDCLLVLDDTFVFPLPPDGGDRQLTQGQVAAAKTDFMLRSLKHISDLSELTSHHYALNCCLLAQDPTIFSGSGVMSNFVRRIKNNFDCFILFKNSSHQARNFFQR